MRHASTIAAPTLVAPPLCVAPTPFAPSATTGLSVLAQMASSPTQHLTLRVLGSPLLVTSILTVNQALCAHWAPACTSVLPHPTVWTQSSVTGLCAALPAAVTMTVVLERSVGSSCAPSAVAQRLSVPPARRALTTSVWTRAPRPQPVAAMPSAQLKDTELNVLAQTTWLVIPILTVAYRLRPVPTTLTAPKE